MIFDLGKGAEDARTLEAVASTSAEKHVAAMAEVQEIPDWRWRRCPRSLGPAGDRNDRDHDLQSSVGDGRWHVVARALTGSGHFVEELLSTFADPLD